MSKIHLKSILEAHGVDPKKAAEVLFPKNMYPYLALNRVMKGKALLDSDQISALAFLLGVPIQSLFDKANWSITSSKEGIIIFTNGEYEAELDMVKNITKIRG